MDSLDFLHSWHGVLRLKPKSGHHLPSTFIWNSTSNSGHLHGFVKHFHDLWAKESLLPSSPKILTWIAKQILVFLQRQLNQPCFISLYKLYWFTYLEIHKTKLREVFAWVCMRGVERGRVLICWKSGNTTPMKYYQPPIFSFFRQSLASGEQ